MHYLSKITFFCFFFFCFEFHSYAQVKEIDKLEMLYSQGHYKMVYRRANRLLDNPEFDYSMMPNFYKSLALFQLSKNKSWTRKNPNSLEEAKTLFLEIKSSTSGMKIFDAHIDEISALKRDLISWAGDLQREGNKKQFDKLQSILAVLFQNVPDMIEVAKDPKEIAAEIVDVDNSMTNKNSRQDIIDIARKNIGVPYVWSGNDPKGFDCSGFATYCYKNIQSNLPRRSQDLYDASKKVKQKNVQPGDLVFFDNGSGISHVGIIISGKGEPLVMIHASTSKGVIITEIEKSEYWTKRLYGFGTFVD
jgi:peptidoglycan DL-endopeptidase CwlO